MKWWFGMSMPRKILVMLIVGAAAGFLLGPKVTVIRPVGDAFIRLLKMLIVPLVFFTLVSGVTRMESPGSLRKIGGFIVSFYLVTTLVSAACGVGIGLLLRPGRGVEGILGGAGQQMNIAKYSPVDTVLNWIPTNPAEAMANMNMIQIIVFALLVGVALLCLKEKADVVIRFMNQMSDVVIKLTEFVMNFAPYGIGALVAVLTGTLGSKMMMAVAKFILADYVGIAIVLVVLYPLLLRFWSVPVARFFGHIAPAMLVAATTTSSAATLPIEMSIAEEKLGLPESIYGFALPLGNTANMNGFAVALGVISVFALDVFQIPLTSGIVLQMLFLGLILSVGAAGVKGAGIVMSAVLFESLGMPLGLVPILAAVWPVIDIPHTTANVTGDLVGTTICGAKYGQLDWKKFDV
jgi:Na+/H+-dicarboxylate symporter